jgi:hypothetical protein
MGEKNRIAKGHQQLTCVLENARKTGEKGEKKTGWTTKQNQQIQQMTSPNRKTTRDIIENYLNLVKTINSQIQEA